MTQTNSHTDSSATRISKLLSQVVLLLLGTPPVLRPVLGVVRVVVGNDDAAFGSRIQVGGFHYGCA
jgi:hypothetical protein